MTAPTRARRASVRGRTSSPTSRAAAVLVLAALALTALGYHFWREHELRPPRERFEELDVPARAHDSGDVNAEILFGKWVAARANAERALVAYEAAARVAAEEQAAGRPYVHLDDFAVADLQRFIGAVEIARSAQERYEDFVGD